MNLVILTVGYSKSTDLVINGIPVFDFELPSVTCVDKSPHDLANSGKSQFTMANNATNAKIKYFILKHNL